MTRRDFELIAGTLANQREYIKSHPAHTEPEKKLMLAVNHLMAVDFANALRQTNPRFDTDRFLKAVGVL